MANIFDTFRTGGSARKIFQQYVPRGIRQSAKDWLAMQYPGMKIGQNSGSWGYEDPENMMTVRDPLYSRVKNSTRDTPTDTPSSPENGNDESDYRYTPSGGGTGGAGTQIEPNNANIGDRVYDLNDPGQLQQYINDIDTKLNGDFEFYSNRSNQAKELDIAQAKRDEEEAIYNINRALKKLGESKSQYTQDYARSVADLAEGFRQGTARRQSFYASVAPRVYQSSQGTSQEYAQGKYREGQKRYEEDKTRAMNAFAETRSDYERSRKQIQNQFKLFKTQREAQSADEIAEKARQTEELRGQARANTLNYTGALRNAGVSSNKFATPTFQEQDLSGYKPSNVNLNDLMQFIKFQPAGVGMGASGQPTQRTAQTMATPEAGGQALGSYMGYAPEEEEQSTINAYKKGYGLY